MTDGVSPWRASNRATEKVDRIGFDCELDLRWGVIMVVAPQSEVCFAWSYRDSCDDCSVSISIGVGEEPAPGHIAVHIR